jgi:hypothetical protein
VPSRLRQSTVAASSARANPQVVTSGIDAAAAFLGGSSLTAGLGSSGASAKGRLVLAFARSSLRNREHDDRARVAHVRARRLLARHRHELAVDLADTALRLT